VKLTKLFYLGNSLDPVENSLNQRFEYEKLCNLCNSKW